MTILKAKDILSSIPVALHKFISIDGTFALPLTLSSAILYKQYGKYDSAAVRREGQLLLTRAGIMQQRADNALTAPNFDADGSSAAPAGKGVQHELDCAALTALHKRYSDWRKKLQQLKYRQLVHGQFVPGKGITLYTAAIAADAAAWSLDADAYYESVLVHECTHALHFAQILAQFGARADDVTNVLYQRALRYWYGGSTQAVQARVVKETLAEYTRYVWCCEKGQVALVQKLMQQFAGARAYFPSYPYAGVRPLCALHEESAAKAYAELWHTSLASWQQAYWKLQQMNY